jgi:hypothetical protein
MEDTQIYREQDDDWTIPDDERAEWVAASEGEPPFHLPRD